jgi:gliding motility associated protien GldN
MRNYFTIFIFAAVFGKAQDDIHIESKIEANPCGLENVLLINKHQVPEAYNREADLVWSKRVWREVDFREKINHPLYYPVEFNPCRISLFQLISKHILTGDITAFADESFYSPLNLSMVRNKLVQSEEVVQVEYTPEGEPKEVKVVAYDSTSIFQKVTKMRVIEDWYLNSGRSDVEVRITGMAFYEYVEDKEAYKELFWVYFPNAKPYLAKYRLFNPRNNNDYSTFDDLFARREFSSYIVKESNVYDRFVTDYCKGTDALLESDRIKYDIFKMEHDLWHY